MRACCKEYSDVLDLITRLENGETLTQEELGSIRQLVQSNYDQHVDQAGEAAWND